VLWRKFICTLLMLFTLPMATHAQEVLPPGPTAFVLIARLHDFPGQADQMIALPGAVDETLEAGEPRMLLHTFDRDPGDSQGFIWTEV
jgi:hypothetical protein